MGTSALQPLNSANNQWASKRPLSPDETVIQANALVLSQPRGNREMVTYEEGGENGAVFVLSWEILQYCILTVWRSNTGDMKVNARRVTSPSATSWSEDETWGIGGRGDMSFMGTESFFCSIGRQAKCPLCAQKEASWCLISSAFQWNKNPGH